MRSQSLIGCFTAAGTGRNHLWRLEVGGQVAAATLAPGNSYGVPVVASVSRSATVAAANDFDTAGGESYRVTGKNFGATWAASSSITLTLTLEAPLNAAGDALGDNAAGQINRTSASCTMVTPHFELTCRTPALAGASLFMRVVVDGQSSTTPSTGSPDHTLAVGMPATYKHVWSTTHDIASNASLRKDPSIDPSISFDSCANRGEIEAKSSGFARGKGQPGAPS